MLSLLSYLRKVCLEVYTSQIYSFVNRPIQLSAEQRYASVPVSSRIPLGEFSEFRSREVF